MKIVHNLWMIFNRAEVLGYGVLQSADTQAFPNITIIFSQGDIWGILILSYLQSTIALMFTLCSPYLNLIACISDKLRVKESNVLP